MKKILFLCAFCASLFALPNCYEINKIEKPSATPKEAVFVLIDETTPFGDSLKEQILNNALKFAEFGNHIFVAKYSAFLDGRYNEVLFEFTLDTPLDEKARYELNKNSLAKFDKCLKDQLGYVRKNMSQKINDAFLKDGESVAKSDIFYALQDFSKNSISPFEAEKKVVLLASDMLENSSITTFYAKGAPRQINAKKELEILSKNELFGDFGEAEIYVVGAGLTETKKGSKGGYVTPQILNSLREFWSSYFSSSNANLVEMGTPALKRSVK